MKRNALRVTVVCAVAAAAVFFVSRAWPAARPHYNVVLITVDALRPDHLGCYGYQRDTSPNIDALAGEGSLFTNALSQGLRTLPSVYSLLTSSYPHTHRISMEDDCLAGSQVTLPSLLNRAGYATGAISGHVIPFNDILSARNPANGFAFYLGHSPRQGHLLADAVTDRAAEFLRVHRKGKFFLWLHYFDPHGPYLPPPPYDGRYVNDGIYRTGQEAPVSQDADQPYLARGVIPFYVAQKGITSIDYYIAQYDAEIRFVDTEIGRLLASIKRLGLEKNTVVILTADHGEHLAKKNLYFYHGPPLCEYVLRVPLIIRLKGVFPPGKRTDLPVAHIDIMPTVLELLQIHPGAPLEGISLIPALRGEGGISSDRPIISEETNYRDGAFYVYHFSYRKEEWRLLYNQADDATLLFNFKKDPDESVNLIESAETPARALAAEFRQWLSGQKIEASPRGCRKVDDETKQRLRSLGYTE